MTGEPGCDPASDAGPRGGPVVGSRPAYEAPPRGVDAAVLVLVAGRPVRVLLVRKSCSAPGRWACDVAFPGGRLEEGEDPVGAALREAWEEARVPPGLVRVVGVMSPERTRVGDVLVAPVVGVPVGPVDPAPGSGEVDAVFWAPLAALTREPRRVPHPRRGVVEGLVLPGGLVLWGLTLRILRRLPAFLADRGIPH